MNNIQKAVNNLVKKHHTNDPFELCRLLNICLYVTELPAGINGFYNTVLGIPFIYLNCTLSDCEIRAVCAHELGHVILHPQINTLFIKTKTIMNAAKLEHEADIFAASLLIPTITILEGQTVTVEQLAYELDVPQELVRTKLYI